MFQLTKIDLGEIKVGSEHKLEFPYNGDINYIKRVTSPCECTAVKNYAKDKKIVAEYKAKEIPIHLKGEGITQVDKSLTIEVEYVNTDGTEGKQNLVFTAIVKE